MTEKSVVGTYQRYWDFEHYSGITLKPDNTFDFAVQEGGPVFLQTAGTWRLQGKYLHLNSYTDTVSSETSALTYKKQMQTGMTEVKVNDERGEPLPGAVVNLFALTDSIGTITDTNGIARFPLTKYDSLKVSL